MVPANLLKAVYVLLEESEVERDEIVGRMLCSAYLSYAELLDVAPAFAVDE